MIDPVLPTYARAPLAFTKGYGPYLEATDGTQYLDFAAGIGVISLGHAHQGCIDALKTQSEALWHTANLYQIPEQERLARRLVDATFADTVFFSNSGVEAVECGIKMARRYHSKGGRPERFRIITIEGAFHGRTLATIAAGGQAKHLDGFGPKTDGFDQAPFGDLDALRAAISPETAAILMEPVLGEGGMRAVSNQFLEDVRALCDEHGILLMLDEVQSGNGRTGKFYAYQHSSVTPDILCTAKGLGNGFPIGACLATEKAASSMTLGSHGSTFGGNPMACAVANAVLDHMLAPDFLDGVGTRAEAFREDLANLMAQFPTVFESIRGRGLMIGLKMQVPAADMVQELRNQQLLTVAAGDNVVRLLPPLIVTEAHCGEALDKIAAAAQVLSQ
jgi:acetylornithine/N-succinyldiaminopimelate aminotransferase